MDFGAPESGQLPTLITRGIDLKEWFDELGTQAIFHIIVVDGGAYLGTIQFLEKMRAALGLEFEIMIWLNLLALSCSRACPGSLKTTVAKTLWRF